MVSPPQIEVVPGGAVSSHGLRAVELAAGAGLHLSEEQQRVLHGGLGLRADGAWTAFEVCVVQPRQNGKSSTLQARILLGLALGEQIAYTSHRVDSAQEVFRGLVALVEASSEIAPLLEKVVYSNGKEAIWLTNGGRCVFGTRSSRTGRGFSLDLWVADEAHILDQSAHDALMPATSARRRAPQVWYAGTAVDEDSNEHGVVLARLRQRSLAGDPASLFYAEWSARLFDDEGAELRPEQVTPEMITVEHVEQANPAYGVRIRPEHVEAEREAMGWRGWLVERCGIGAWPDVTGVVESPISGEEWAELVDRHSKIVGELVLVFDVGRDRQAALVACGRRGVDGLLHVELLRTEPGTAWLREELERLDSRHDVREILADDYGGNRALLGSLANAGLKVRAVSGSETVAACSKLLDLVAERGFRHLGQVGLHQALRGARSKAVGDAWVWSRKASSGDAAVAVAMTLALAAGSEIPADISEADDLLTAWTTPGGLGLEQVRPLDGYGGLATYEPSLDIRDRLG